MSKKKEVMENLIGTRKSKRLKGRRVIVHHSRNRDNKLKVKHGIRVVQENEKVVKDGVSNRRKLFGNSELKTKTTKETGNNENKYRKSRKGEETKEENQLEENKIKIEPSEEILKENIENKVTENCTENNGSNSESSKCKLCGKQFKNKYGLNQHVTLTHSLFCRLCRIQFESKAEFCQHELEKHDIFWQENGNKMYRCDICNKLCKDKSKLECHKKSHNTELLYKCDFCGKMLKTETTLRYHVKTKHDNSQKKEFKCDICEKEFWNNSEMKKHKRVHTNERPYLCQFCSLGFKTNGNLMNHEKAVHGDKTWTCEICGKGFISKKKSMEHCFVKKYAMNKPPPLKPFPCKECGKLFARKNDLKIHFRIHSGVRPYKCKVCGKGFKCANHLKQHNVLHTGEKPFTCTYCGKGFTQTANVRCHMRKCQFTYKLYNDYKNKLDSKGVVKREEIYDDDKSQISQTKGNSCDLEEAIKAQDLSRAQKQEFDKLFHKNKSKNKSEDKKRTMVSLLNVCEKGTQSEIVVEPLRDKTDEVEDVDLKEKVYKKPTKIIFVDASAIADGYSQLKSLFEVPVTGNKNGEELNSDTDGSNSSESNTLKTPVTIKGEETAYQNVSLESKGPKIHTCTCTFATNQNQNSDQNMPHMVSVHKSNENIPHVETDSKATEGPTLFYEAEVPEGTGPEENINEKTNEDLYEGLNNNSSPMHSIIVIPEISMDTSNTATCISESGIILPIVDNESSGVVFAEIDDNGVLNFVPINDPGNAATVILKGENQSGMVTPEHEPLVHGVEDLNNEPTSIVQQMETSDIL